MKDALEAVLGTNVSRAVKVAGGASKEAWAVDTVDGQALFVRRAMGGVIHLDTLSLRDEFELLVAARDAGVTVPEPVAYIPDLDGREAFVMARVEGESIGRRIVRDPPPGLARRMANELAAIHAIPAETVAFLPDHDVFSALAADLASVGTPHPAIEYGLRWCRERIPLERAPVVCHGDFRVGNLLVADGRLTAVLDWEFAHLGDPADDLSWPLVRAWRFGRDELRFGGVDDPEPFLERYAYLTGVEIPSDELRAWEVLGNCKWAIGSLKQGRRHLLGEDRSVEFAILGRLAAETELEVLELIARSEGRPSRRGAVDEAVVHDRPSAGELAAAVREFLEQEILPTIVEDHRLKFRTLVAMNALGIVERESPPPIERDTALAEAIRREGTEAADLDALRAEVESRVRVTNPNALTRYE